MLNPSAGLPTPAMDVLEKTAKYAAASGSSAAAGRLRWLRSILEQRNPAQVNALATNDLNQLLDTDGLVEGIKVRDATPAWLGVLEWFRNILVLVPLVFTWYEISQASEAYQQYLDAAQDANLFRESFLYLWQKGFGGYLHGPFAFTLGTLALVDALVLGSVVVVTFFISGRVHFYSSLRERKAEELREKVADALSAVSLEVATSPTNAAQPVNIVSYFDQVARQLLAEMETTRHAIEQLVQEQRQNFQQQIQVTGGLTQAAQAMQAAAQKFEQTGQGLERTAQNFHQTAQTFAQVNQDMQQTNQGLQQTNQALQQTALDLRNSVAALTQGVNNLAVEEGNLVQAAKAIGSKLDTVTMKQDTWLDRQDQILTDVTQALTQLKQDLGALGQKADAAVNTLGAAGNQMDNLAQQVQALYQQQQIHVSALQQMQQDQNLMISGLTKVIDSVANTMTQLPSLQNKMLDLWTEADKTVRLLGTMPDVVKKNLDSLLNAHHRAAGELANSSRLLEHATSGLTNSSLMLTGATGELTKSSGVLVGASQEFKTGVDRLRTYFP